MSKKNSLNISPGCYKVFILSVSWKSRCALISTDSSPFYWSIPHWSATDTYSYWLTSSHWFPKLRIIGGVLCLCLNLSIIPNIRIQIHLTNTRLHAACPMCSAINQREAEQNRQNFIQHRTKGKRGNLYYSLFQFPLSRCHRADESSEKAVGPQVPQREQWHFFPKTKTYSSKSWWLGPSNKKAICHRRRLLISHFGLQCGIVLLPAHLSPTYKNLNHQHGITLYCM